MAVETLVIKLTREETLDRLERMGTFINRETGEQDNQTYLPISHETTLDRQRDHWAKLHTQSFDASAFESWVATIPGCSTCQRDFRKLLETNPPRYDDWFRWTVEIHNLVNQKLGKPILSFEEASQLHRDRPLESPDQ
jgi:hypothetical protein